MASPSPTVSVVMPVYHVEKYVAEAIRSVLSQTYTDLELIIVDDGGRDGSIAICESFDDPRIRILRQENRGLAGARNTGIAAARGRYVALIDSDDVWEVEKLALHVAHLDGDATIGASYAGSTLIDVESHPIGITQQPLLGAVDAVDVFCGRVIQNGSNPVFRRTALEDAALPRDAEGRVWYFDETLRRSEDVECWTRIALRTDLRFAGIPGSWTRYRVNAAALSADVIRQLDSWDQACERLAGIDPAFIAAHRQEARARELRYLARRSVQMRERGLAMTLIVESLKTRPSLLWMEPRKTLTTLGACAALRALPDRFFGNLMAFACPRLARSFAT